LEHSRKAYLARFLQSHQVRWRYDAAFTFLIWPGSLTGAEVMRVSDVGAFPRNFQGYLRAKILNGSGKGNEGQKI